MGTKANRKTYFKQGDSWNIYNNEIIQIDDFQSLKSRRKDFSSNEIHTLEFTRNKMIETQKIIFPDSSFWVRFETEWIE